MKERSGRREKKISLSICLFHLSTYLSLVPSHLSTCPHLFSFPHTCQFALLLTLDPLYPYIGLSRIYQFPDSLVFPLQNISINSRNKVKWRLHYTTELSHMASLQEWDPCRLVGVKGAVCVCDQ